ncbi:ABC transporter permease [Neisseria wadsworthii]|uniref:ABC superfamily ATP binding cassette transporter permease n=1 Tax=Neisseria wadsworthii 9715 TaxID=1030841 RepID=G4CQC1_9NEIS|nr:ABC transporter permease [Neisseria wadsworthii]EGZ46526.1 ABC superfamily ATP binding cassette transporter permease [Neisseria wadsworthii 9715]QMT35040.1 ABC transporter permease [Neisseria wadsworthii]
MIGSSLIKELKLLRHDLHGLAVLFVMPIVFMLIMSLALSRDEDPHIDSRIALVGAADNPVNKDFAAALRKEQVDLVSLSENRLNEAKSGLYQGRYQLLVVNPNQAGGKLDEEQMLQLIVPPDIDPSWLSAVQGVLQQRYTEVRLNSYFDGLDDLKIETKNLPKSIKQKIQKSVNEENGKQFDTVAAYLKKTLFSETYLTESGAVEKPNAVQHSVPAWLIFGMFFIMIPLSNVMALERQTNTITRLRLAQAPAGVLVAAKLLPYFLINQLQFVGMLLLGCYLLPVLGAPALVLSNTWWPYAVLSVAVSGAALGYALLISVSAKSTEHAVVLGGGGIILMAGLGGIMVPDYVMPETMQRLTWISPMAWGLKAFQELLLKQSGIGGISLYLQLLAGFSLVCIAISLLLYRRQLRTQVRF